MCVTGDGFISITWKGNKMYMVSFVNCKIANKLIGTVKVDSYIGISKEEVLEKAFRIYKEYFQDKYNNSVYLEIDTIFVNENVKVGVSRLIERIKYSLINWSLSNCFLCKIFLTPKLYKPQWWKYHVGNLFINDTVTREQITRVTDLISSCSTDGVCEIDYTNYLGQRRWRRVTLRWRPRFGTDKYHVKQQWLLDVYAHDRDDKRTLAMSDIHGWRKLV